MVEKRLHQFLSITPTQEVLHLNYLMEFATESTLIITVTAHPQDFFTLTQNLFPLLSLTPNFSTFLVFSLPGRKLASPNQHGAHFS